MTDVRELYQAKQAAGKVNRITYDETVQVDRSIQIRSHPMSASPSSERELKCSSTNKSPNHTKSTSIIKNSKFRSNYSSLKNSRTE